AAAGAGWAGLIPLRLPGAVKDVFLPWLDAHYPERKEKILHRIQSMKGGKLNDARFHSRFRGSGVFAEQLGALFHGARERHGLARRGPTLSTSHFRVPGRVMQPTLF
ncbi:MAG TPA: hypothetical protein PLD59_07565, partial [Tepidisphaeraceae bacterium]|nr:hypothetical protein [Tepidisphaeraceae bacterium]